MREVQEIMPFPQALADILSDEVGRKVSADEIELKEYCYDARNGWDNFLVTVGGMAVGYTDGVFRTI